MILRLAPPARLDVTTHKAALQPGAFPQLQRLDIQRYPGRTRRGPGVSRAIGVAGSSSTIVACGVFQRRDCRLVLVDQSAGGTVRAHVGQGFGYISPACVGPVPELVELRDDEHGNPGGSFNDGDGTRKLGSGQRDEAALAAAGGCEDPPADAPCDTSRAGQVHMYDCPSSCPKSKVRVVRIVRVRCEDGDWHHVLCDDAQCPGNTPELELEEWCLGGAE